MLHSTLARGEEQGGVQLIVAGSWQPLNAIVRGDNAVDRSLATATETVQLSFNGLLGLGETIYGYAATSDPVRPFASDTRVRVLGGGLIVAPSDGRLTLNPEATISRTLAAVPADVPRTEGRLTRYAARAAYIVEQTRSRRMALDLSVEALDQRSTAIDFASDLARDHYAAARLGISYSAKRARASWSLSAQIGQGLGRLGADTAPPTRQGATNCFTKLTAQGRTTLVVSPHLILSGISYIQTSFGRPLLRAEQFQLEGNDAVSAYVGGVTTVDEGATVRIEAATAVTAGSFPLAPYLFASGGYGRVARPTSVEVRALTAGALGAGTRVTILSGRASVGIEYAYGLSTLASLNRRDRVNVNAALRF